MSRTATAMQNGIDEVYDEPGLQSVASATVAPASIRRRPDGYGCRVENSTPGSSVTTVSDAARAATSASARKVAWSTLAAPSSMARRIASDDSVSWPACIRIPRPRAAPA